MQVHAIQGYFDDGVFYQQGRRVALPDRKLVIVNILDIPIDIDETKKTDKEFWKEFDSLAKDSIDDKLMLADFPRMDLGREIILFTDEEIQQ